MESAPKRISKLGVAKFVGDRRWAIVHEWLFKKEECNIVEIPVDSMVFFDPDILEEAERNGFKPCPRCLPHNQIRG